MSKLKKIAIWGGFHNQMTPIVINVPADFDMSYYGLSGLLEFGVSAAVAKKIREHMCGIKDCMCGPHHGWQIRDVD